MLCIPKTIKKKLKDTIRSAHIDDVFLNMSRKEIRILMFHQISSKSIPVDVFEVEMEFIRDHFETYWLCEIPSLLEKISKGYNPERPAVVITFDDGFRNQIFKAFPILSAQKIKSTIFLLANPQGGMLWNHELICRFLSLSDADLMKVCTQNNLSFSGKTDPEGVRNIVEQVKTWRKERREEFLGNIRQLTPNFAPLDWMKDEYELISGSDIKNIPLEFVEIGCHTFQHPILNQVDDACAHQEIVQSKDALEKLISRPVYSFCYPNGDFSNRDLKLVQEHYTCAVAGLGFAGKNPFLFRRIAAHPNFDDFKWSLIFGK